MEITEDAVAEALPIIGELEALYGYPRTDAGIVGLTKRVLRFVGDLDKLRWLVDKVGSTQKRLPSPVEMRELYTSGKWAGHGPYPPADGVEVSQL